MSQTHRAPRAVSLPSATHEGRVSTVSPSGGNAALAGLV